MRRVLTVALAAGLFFGTMTATPPAHAEHHRSCIGWEYRVRRTTPPDVRDRRVRRLIRCVFAEVGIGSQAAYAVTIASRESGLAPWAYNASSCATGLFQHICTYWDGRAANLPAREFPRHPNSSAWNGRANTWAAAIMVRASGWGAWTTAS